LAVGKVILALQIYTTPTDDSLDFDRYVQG